MTINRRTVRALCGVRERLRDLALAEHSSSSQNQLRAEELLEAARCELEHTLARAPGVIEAAQTVDELDRMSQLVAAHHVCLDDASAEVAAAVIVTEEAAQRLRHSARQALTAERLMKRHQREDSRKALRQEQRMHDDRGRRRLGETKPR